MEFVLGTAVGGLLLRAFSNSDIQEPLGANEPSDPSKAPETSEPTQAPAVPNTPVMRNISTPSVPKLAYLHTGGPYGELDVAEPYGNELDAQYMAYMKTMREGITSRKAAVADRIERIKHAEETSETARVLKILETPVADREPDPIGDHMPPAWMRQTTAPRTVRTKIFEPLPPPQDVFKNAQNYHDKQQIASFISGGRAGTSTYNNWARPVDEVWTGYGTGQGGIAPKWDRETFLLARTDDDEHSELPPQSTITQLPIFRDQENTSRVPRSFNLNVDTTSGPGQYPVSSGAAVVQPSIQAPLNDATLQIGPLGVAQGYMSGGVSTAPQASIRVKQGAVNAGPEYLPPNQIAAFSTSSSVQPSIRLAQDTSTAIVSAADAAGRAYYTAQPATDMSTNPERDAADIVRSDRAAQMAQLLNTSAPTYVSATPAVQSGSDGSHLVAKEELLARTSELMQYMDQISGTNAGATPSEFVASAQKQKLMELQSNVANALQMLAQYSGTAGSGAVAGEIDHLKDDHGHNPAEPDGRGATTISKDGVNRDTEMIQRAPQGYSYEQMAPHTAFAGVSVTHGPESAQMFTAEGLRTTDTHELLSGDIAQQGVERASDITRLGQRGTTGAVRMVDTVVPTGTTRKNMGQAATASVPASAPVTSDVTDPMRQNIWTATTSTNIGRNTEKLGTVLYNTDISLKTPVNADRDVESLVPPARGASAPVPEYTPVRSSKAFQVDLSVTGQSRNPMGTSTPTVRDVLLGRRRDY